MRAEGEPGGVNIVRWRGVLAEGGTALRCVSAAVLAVACVALAFTQTGFVGVQFASGDAAYLVVLLAPVALAALLLGTLPGAGVGLFAGAVLFAHASLMPFDYYELTFVTPFTSIVMMTLCGLLLGVLFALVLRRERAAWARAVLLTLTCLAVSSVFSAGFSASTVALLAQGLGAGQVAQVQAQVREIVLTAGSAVFQAVGDALIMAVAALIARRCAERGLEFMGRAGLRAVFGAWLSAVLAVAFMVVATGAYVAISASALSQAHEDMAGEVDYLLGQVERTADYNGKVAKAVLEAGGGTGDGELGELLSDGILASLLEGYTEEADGLVLAAIGKYLIGSDANRFDASETLGACLPAEALEAATRSAAEGTLERVVYEAPSAMNDLVDFALPSNSDAFDSLLASQVGYLVAAQHDGYLVAMVRPASMVFAERDDVMGWVTAAFLVLLAAVFALAWRLLDLMVARRIDAANGALARITAGELDARVSAEGTREFVELAAGINGTVDALQGWIAEAESRMDAELATAKAIQESALPRVFPPYPDILKFDVYATMDAAREVGGDFYDFFLIGDADAEAGKLGFVIADVSGKGVPAALFMMKAKTQLRDYLEAGMQVGEAVENANRQLCDGNDAGMFVTCWVGVLDYATGRVEFVNAGHNPPLLWRSDGGGGDVLLTGSWTWLKEKSGLPLGLFDGMPYETHAIDCRAGDTFLLYTDGVTEAMSVEGDLYGEARLEALANANATLHPRELVACVRRDVAAHAAGAEQSDDITVLALEVGVPPEEKAVLAVPADVAELPRVNEFIHAELDRRLCPVRAQGQLDIAVEELFVNVCRYAYEDMPPEVPRTVRVTYAYSAEPPGITVEIIDAGAPYDPLAKPDAATADEYASVADIPVGGLGILMAKSSVDEMSYERAGDSNVVTLVKRW